MSNEAVLLVQLLQLDSRFSLCVHYNDIAEPQQPETLHGNLAVQTLVEFIGLEAHASSDLRRRLRIEFDHWNRASASQGQLLKRNESSQKSRRLRAMSGQPLWQRAEGVSFDMEQARPLLEPFDALHRLFIARICGSRPVRRR